MKVLVTGSTGFIGGALCRALAAQGHEVHAFHRASSALRVLEDLPVVHEIGDLTQAETIQPAMLGIEVVFHAAALLGGNDDPGRMYAVTVEGTRALLEAARKAGVRRVVHTSSVAALGVPESGPVNQPCLLNESHTWNYLPERWPYGYTKYMAELEVQKAVAQGQDIVIVNPSIVFGAGDVYRQTSSLVVQVARHKLPALVEGGANFVHLQDVVDGHLAALEKGVCGERYILAGENLTLVKAIEKVAAVVGARPPLIVLPGGVARALAGPAALFKNFIDLPAGPEVLYLAGKYFYYDNHKAQVELGLATPRPVEGGMAEAYAWFQQVGAIPLKKEMEPQISADKTG
jgi:dihydroflavonol-4-reductase